MKSLVYSLLFVSLSSASSTADAEAEHQALSSLRGFATHLVAHQDEKNRNSRSSLTKKSFSDFEEVGCSGNGERCLSTGGCCSGLYCEHEVDIIRGNLPGVCLPFPFRSEEDSFIEETSNSYYDDDYYDDDSYFSAGCVPLGYTFLTSGICCSGTCQNFKCVANIKWR